MTEDRIQAALKRLWSNADIDLESLHWKTRLEFPNAPKFIFSEYWPGNSTERVTSRCEAAFREFVQRYPDAEVSA